MGTMSATISIAIGENPTPSPANPSPSPSRENKMETPMKRPRRYNFSLPTFSWGAQRVSPWVKDPSSISSHATLPPLPPPNPSLEKEEKKEKEKLVLAEIPWKLRKRKADTSSLVDNVVAAKEKEKEKEKEKAKEKRETKLSVPLSSMEIRNDFLLMKGKKPAPAQRSAQSMCRSS